MSPSPRLTPITPAQPSGCRACVAVFACLAVAILLAPGTGWAQTRSGGAPSGGVGAGDWRLGAVIDSAYMGEPLPLGLRDRGWGMGHSDLMARGALGRHFSAEGVLALSTHDGALEKGVEKLFLQTRTLPAGLQMRAGRFASQVGYLNEQHPHADDFVERPLLYRAFLGHHYFDDGMRLNWTAPTPFYLQLGAEAFGGRKLSPESPSTTRAGVSTFTIKLGSDIGTNQAWQAGAAVLLNRRAWTLAHDGHAGQDHALAEGDHASGHGAALAGRRLALFDLAWKWAPHGNPRERQWRVLLEHARLGGLPQPVLAGRQHEGSSLSVLWRFRPDWEVGIRADRLHAAFAHDDHFDAARLQEHSTMLVYKPSHRQSVRLQWTAHRNAQGFEGASRPLFALQYVVAFGAHGAHNF